MQILIDSLIPFDVISEDNDHSIVKIENLFFFESKSDFLLRINKNAQEHHYKIIPLENSIFGAGYMSLDEMFVDHYFSYFLFKKQTYPDIEIPSYIFNLYSKLGLFSKNKEYQSLRLPVLKSLLIQHSYSHGFKNTSLFEEIAKEFPECIYSGVAFRAIITENGGLDEDSLKQSLTSWSLSLNGIEKFLKPIVKKNGYYIVKSYIKGVSLIHLHQFYNLNIDRVGEEEEIVQLENLGIIDIDYFNS